MKHTKLEITIELRFNLEKFQDFVEWAYGKSWRRRLRELMNDAMEEIAEYFKLNGLGAFRWKVKQMKVIEE